MHSFCYLVMCATQSNIINFNRINKKITRDLQKNAATSLVTALQSVQLQKTIHVVGVFSIFEAVLQESLNCKDGFKTASKILKQKGEHDLEKEFSDMHLAINALKHGRGRSYDLLVKNPDGVSFKVRGEDECFFNEGDVAEISTLIKVDDDFLLRCADIIYRVSVVVGIER